jgi:translation initiation factor 2 subunit 1
MCSIILFLFKIEEYGKQGLIHISEVSPGRIRNIRDFVKEGKMVVCKVIKIDEGKRSY